jgi:polar amino acid transport system permease protein
MEGFAAWLESILAPVLQWLLQNEHVAEAYAFYEAVLRPVLSHTGHLAGGFAMNLLISVLSMGVGTVIGVALGRLRHAGVRRLEMPSRFATSICRNVPSFVLLFYMASMIPSEITFDGTIYAVPLWIKATLALIFPVIGFSSDQSLGYFQQRDAGLKGARETFLVAWAQYFLIIIMASATASIIGADEIVGRANTLIAQQGGDTFLISMYLFVSVWFIASGLILTTLVKGVSRRIAKNE